MKCRLCQEKLKDPVSIIYYEEINQKIEELYPRHMYDIFIKDVDLQIIANATTGKKRIRRQKSVIMFPVIIVLTDSHRQR